MKGIRRGKWILVGLMAVLLAVGTPQMISATEGGDISEDAPAALGERFEIEGVGYRKLSDHTVQLTDWETASGTITIPEQIEKDGKSFTVVSIGSKAFYRDWGASSLRVVHFPDTITDIGAEAFQNAMLTELTLPVNLKAIGNKAFTSACVGASGPDELVIPDSVTAIGKAAFWECSSFVSVKLPQNLTVLEEQVFRGCTRLSNVELPEKMETIRANAFTQCTVLQTLTLPEGLKRIGGQAFSNSGITQLTIPENVKVIENTTFSKCKSLTAVTLPAGLREIKGLAFEGCAALQEIVIPEGVTRIPQECFKDCSDSLTVTFPDTIDYIHPSFSGVNDAQHATYKFTVKCKSRPVAEYLWSVGHRNILLNNETFSPDEAEMQFEDDQFIYRVTDSEKKYVRLDRKSGAQKLTGKVEIPSTVTHNGTEYTITGIGYLVFYRNTDMTEVVIPNTVKNIGREAFYDCTGLTKVTLPDELLGIDNLAFYGCSSLEGVFRIPESCINIGSGAFKNCGFTGVTLPQSMTEIPSSLFLNCTNLKSITIPSGVTEIGGSAFYGCTGLTDVMLPQNLTEIGTFAFRNCSALTGLTLPEGLAVIGESAFDSCTGLQGTLVLPDSVKSVETNAFNGCTDISRIHVGNGIQILLCDAVPETARLTAYDEETKELLIKNTNRTGDALPELLWNGKGNIPEGTNIKIGEDIVISGSLAIGANSVVTVEEGVSVTIEEGARLTVAEGAVLTIEAGGSVTADGTLTNNGKTEGLGNLEINGVLDGTGTLGETVLIRVILTDAMVTETEEKIYTGTPFTPEPEVSATIGGRKIVFEADRDFSFGYDANTMPGQANITVTPKEGGMLSGAAVTKHFTIQKASQAAPECTVNVALNGDKTSFAVEIQVVEGAEYSFNGTDWTENNTKSYGPNEAYTAYIRKKESATHTASASQEKNGTTPKLEREAPECVLTFTLNADRKTYTAKIQEADGAEYSFNGTDWTEGNTKEDCLPETEYTAYIRLKEDASYYVSQPGQATLKTPKLPQDEKTDEEKKPVAPSIASISANAYKTGIYVDITVNPVSDADRYEIYRVAGGQTVLIGTTTSGGVSLQDTNPVKEAAYYAVAVLKDGALKSEAGTPSPLTLAKAPKIRKVSAVSGGVRLTWKKLKGANKYVVYRSTKKNSGYQKIKTLGKKKTVFLDRKAKKGKTYYYKVAVLTKSQPSLMSKASKKARRS